MSQPQIPPNLMTTYYVVPLKPATADKFAHCAYFTADWMGITNNVLDSNSADFETDFVRLVQPTFAQLQDNGIDTSTVDANATLFAGVAKTQGTSLGLSNLLVANERTLVVPVADGTSRGLILVFTRPDAKGKLQLVASSDPEIQNGSNGGTGGR